MAYKFLVGNLIGWIFRNQFDVFIVFFPYRWVLALLSICSTIFLRKYWLICSFTLTFYGFINSLSIPKFKKISIDSAKIAYTGALGLSSNYAVIQRGKVLSLVKGTNLNPGMQGIVVSGNFKQRHVNLSKTLPQSNLHIWSEYLKNFILSKTQTLPHSIKCWMEALLLGKLGTISQEFIDALKFLGIYHIAIISGLHIGILCKILKQTLQIPINLLYAIRILTPTWQILITILTDILFLFFLVIYADSLCFTEPIQRAIILFGIGQIHSFFKGKTQQFSLTPYCLCFQTFIFPLGFISTSTIMSWTAYFVAMLPENYQRGSIYQQRVVKQLLFAMLTASILGEFSLVGIIINILLSTLLPSLLISAIALIFFCGVYPKILVSREFLFEI